MDCAKSGRAPVPRGLTLLLLVWLGILAASIPASHATTSCPVGYLLGADNSCTPCPLDTFSSAPDSRTCTPCNVAGHFGAQPGSSVCSCLPDYAFVSATNTCSACPSGTCAPGYSLAAPSVRCGTCPESLCGEQKQCFVVDFEEYAVGEVVTSLGNDVTAVMVPFAGKPHHDLRIFDSSNPDPGDPDLGAPNEKCTPPGPGKGAGGVPGKAGENCQRHGKVLIISGTDAPTGPNDSADGGYMVFTFPRPVSVSSMAVLDMDDPNLSSIITTNSSGVNKTFSLSNYGDNSFQRRQLNVDNVVKLVVKFTRSGAILDLQYCWGSSTASSNPLSFVKDGAYYKRTVSANTYGEFLSAFSPGQISVATDDLANPTQLCFTLSRDPCVMPASRQSLELQTCPSSAANGVRSQTCTPPENNPLCTYLPVVSGEVWSRDYFQYGTIIFTAQPRARSGVVSSVFTFHGVTTAQEPVHQIIISFAGLETRKVVTNVKVWPQGGGAPIDYSMYVSLGFDWNATSHTYSIRWGPESIEWRVDGVLLRRIIAGGDVPVPTTAGRVMAHSWAVSESAVIAPFRSFTGSFNVSDSSNHTFCLSCFRFEPFEKSQCAVAPPPEGTSGSTCANYGDSNPPSPSVQLSYDNSHQAFTVKVQAGYYPDSRVVVLLTKNVAAVEDDICHGAVRSGCFVTIPLGNLTFPGAAPTATSDCALDHPYNGNYDVRTPWFLTALDRCRLEAKLTVPYDSLLSQCPSDLNVITGGSSIILTGYAYAALVTPTDGFYTSPPSNPSACTTRRQSANQYFTFTVTLRSLKASVVTPLGVSHDLPSVLVGGTEDDTAVFSVLPASVPVVSVQPGFSGTGSNRRITLVLTARSVSVESISFLDGRTASGEGALALDLIDRDGRVYTFAGISGQLTHSDLGRYYSFGVKVTGEEGVYVLQVDLGVDAASLGTEGDGRTASSASRMGVVLALLVPFLMLVVA